MMDREVAGDDDSIVDELYSLNVDNDDDDNDEPCKVTPSLEEIVEDDTAMILVSPQWFSSSS
jgi:hypothetical protein